MNHYDVIVVGAGPAGNMAAWQLARAGAKVALIEKQVLPRHKTCGGGMPMAVGQTLLLEELRDLAPDAFVEADTRFMRHTFHFSDPYLAPMNREGDSRAISLWMVRRAVFDNALAQRAARAGAELRDGLAVRAIESKEGGQVTVRAEGRYGTEETGHAVTWEATADTLIGADGANGLTARLANLRRHRVLAIAIEAEVPHRWGDGHPDLRPDICHLEYGVRNGYAWVFPKSDHLNVGAGFFRPQRQNGRGDATAREELHKTILGYLELLGVPKREEDLTFHAHPLPIWNGLDTLQTRDNRILLAGDAAGLINPFFGDGILHALKSGTIAAESILRGEQANYTRAIGDEFRQNFDAALKLAKFFYQWPGFVYRYGVKRPGATHTAARLLCGDVLFHNVTGRVVRRIREAMKDSRKEAFQSGASGSSPDDLNALADNVAEL